MNSNGRAWKIPVVSAVVVALLVGTFGWMRGVSTTLTIHAAEIVHLQAARAELEKMRADIAELKAHAKSR